MVRHGPFVWRPQRRETDARANHITCNMCPKYSRIMVVCCIRVRKIHQSCIFLKSRTITEWVYTCIYICYVNVVIERDECASTPRTDRYTSPQNVNIAKVYHMDLNSLRAPSSRYISIQVHAHSVTNKVHIHRACRCQREAAPYCERQTGLSRCFPSDTLYRKHDRWYCTSITTLYCTHITTLYSKLRRNVS